MSDNIFYRLKEVRDELGLTQDAAADLCSIKRETWNRYEKGKMLPGSEVLTALAHAGGDVNYILTGIRTENTAKGSIELAYLRNCRALATTGKHQAGLTLLSTLREAMGIELYPNQPAEKTKTEP